MDQPGSGKGSQPKGPSLHVSTELQKGEPTLSRKAASATDPVASADPQPSGAPQLDALVSIIKQAVVQGMQEATASTSGVQRKAKTVRDLPYESLSDVSDEELYSPGEAHSELSEEGEVFSEEEITFDPTAIENLVKAVRKTLCLSEELPKSSSADKFFPSVRKRQVTFPVHDSIKEISSEWKRTEKKFVVQGKFAKKYPVEEFFSKLWDNPPKVDAAVVRLARKTTLPVDDAAAFRDPMEKRIETNLKKTFIAAGATCRPAVAMTSTSRAMKVWLNNLKDAISSNVKRSGLREMLSELKLAVDFMTDTSLDLVHLASRTMALSVSSRRALWLKPWLADSASKVNLCQLPFEGEMLFGEKLDSIIKKASGGKSVFLPQEKRFRRQGGRPSSPINRSFRGSRQPRYGRTAGRQTKWKSTRGESRPPNRRSSTFSSSHTEKKQ
ncbi:uncharacterized protein LOC121397783 [Xenopus laevis]|uniref:Uncharacterized protein LOC121397783 n=1 Tax=Xenopus laevis TaxID=8355 RepID=A0A8J1LNQ5_XENLA|nr:uncharacterized protein LOC121397783 [Xenopus laevis]